MKEYRSEDFQEVEDIHKAKFLFSNNGIPVILPIKNIIGEYIFNYNGYFYSIFPFINGKTKSKITPTDNLFKSTGAMLAKIHLISKSRSQKSIEREAKEWSKEAFTETSSEIKRKIAEKKIKDNFDLLAIDSIALKESLVNKNELNYSELGLENDHLLHGDYHGENLFFDNNQNVEHVFDLEATKYGSRMSELVRSMDLICFTDYYSENSLRNAQKYLSTYNLLYPFTKHEFNSGLQYYFMKKAHSLWIETEHYINESTRVDVLLRKENSMLNYYSKNLNNLLNLHPETSPHPHSHTLDTSSKA